MFLGKHLSFTLLSSNDDYCFWQEDAFVAKPPFCCIISGLIFFLVCRKHAPEVSFKDTSVYCKQFSIRS